MVSLERAESRVRQPRANSIGIGRHETTFPGSVGNDRSIMNLAALGIPLGN